MKIHSLEFLLSEKKVGNTACMKHTEDYNGKVWSLCNAMCLHWKLPFWSVCILYFFLSASTDFLHCFLTWNGRERPDDTSRTLKCCQSYAGLRSISLLMPPVCWPRASLSRWCHHWSVWFMTCFTWSWTAPWPGSACESAMDTHREERDIDSVDKPGRKIIHTQLKSMALVFWYLREIKHCSRPYCHGADKAAAMMLW